MKTFGAIRQEVAVEDADVLTTDRLIRARRLGPQGGPRTRVSRVRACLRAEAICCPTPEADAGQTRLAFLRRVANSPESRVRPTDADFLVALGREFATRRVVIVSRGADRRAEFGLPSALITKLEGICPHTLCRPIRASGWLAVRGARRFGLGKLAFAIAALTIQRTIGDGLATLAHAIATRRRAAVLGTRRLLIALAFAITARRRALSTISGTGFAILAWAIALAVTATGLAFSAVFFAGLARLPV